MTFVCYNYISIADHNNFNSIRGNAMNQCQSSYHSYLLRLWYPGEYPGEKATLRIRLEDIGSGEHRCFSDLENLCVFLETRGKEEEINNQ